MPATSQAAMRRKLLALEPEKDPKRVAAGRKAAQAKYGKTDQQMKGSEAGKRSKGVARGGQQATAKAVAPLIKFINDEQTITRTRVKAIAVRNAEGAVNTLVRLMRNDDGDTPAAVRRLAALDILELAQAGKDGQNSGDKPMEEMSIDELQAFIQSATQQIAEAEAVEIEGDFTTEPATDNNRQPD